MTAIAQSSGCGRSAQIAVECRRIWSARCASIGTSWECSSCSRHRRRWRFSIVAGCAVLVGSPDRPEIDHPASIIYYSVPDIRAAHRTLEARGVEFITPPHLVARLPDHDLWLAFFRDSEDNILASLSEIRPG